MKHCKRILLLVVVMVILIAGLSCTAFASSQTGAEDWRISGKNGEYITLEPGLEFSTQSTFLIPDYAGWISEIDKNVFENAYFDESKKLLYLKVNEELTSNTKATVQLHGFWFWQKKDITVSVDVGPKYLPNLTLGIGEERIAQLPYGVKSVEVMAGSENVAAANYGTDCVLVKGKAEGDAKVSVQYYKEDGKSIESYTFKVSVCDQQTPIDYSTALNKRGHTPMGTLGFAPNTLFAIEGKGLTIDKDCVHGSVQSSICFNLTEDAEKGDVCKLTVPTDIWKINPDSKQQEPTVYTLHYGYQKEHLNFYDEYRQLLAKVPVDSDEKVWIGGKDIDKFHIETPVLQDGAEKVPGITPAGGMYKFYFAYLDWGVVPDSSSLSICVVTGKKATEYSGYRWLNNCTEYCWTPSRICLGSSESSGFGDLSSLKIKFDPEMLEVCVYKGREHGSWLHVQGLKLGDTVVYEECKRTYLGYKANTVSIRPKLRYIRKGNTFTVIDGPINIESFVGRLPSYPGDFYVYTHAYDKKNGQDNNVNVIAQFDRETGMLSVSMPNSVDGDCAEVVVEFYNGITGKYLVLPYTLRAVEHY